MDKLKAFLSKHFEKILVASIFFGAVAINYFVPYKIGFLNFFYLPVIVAGYYLGKRFAVLTAILCALVVAWTALLFPQTFFADTGMKLYVIISLLAWGSFLILTSAAMGYLYEEKEKKIKELRQAYIGVIEILSKYLESSDRYTKGHSIRVAHLSEDIAHVMRLPRFEIENIRTAGLLHDIGKTEVSMELINKAATLTTEEKEGVDTHAEKGAQLLSLVAGALKEAVVPLVLAHHKYYFVEKQFGAEEMKAIPLGAAIIAVADTYDAIITDRPYRAGKVPWQAFEEIAKETGRQFHPQVVEALKQVLVAEGIAEEQEPVPKFSPPDTQPS
ncbi:MAG: HD domain-containing protein [bacterium]|nr:HD domain-containing protein [bacterium]